MLCAHQPGAGKRPLGYSPKHKCPPKLGQKETLLNPRSSTSPAGVSTALPLWRGLSTFHGYCPWLCIQSKGILQLSPVLLVSSALLLLSFVHAPCSFEWPKKYKTLMSEFLFRSAGPAGTATSCYCILGFSLPGTCQDSLALPDSSASLLPVP